MTESESRTPVTASRITATVMAAVTAAVVVLALLIAGVYFVVWSTDKATDRFCEKRNDCSDVGQ